MDDDGIFFIWVCGLRTRSSPIPDIGLGGLVTRPDTTVLGGLPYASSVFTIFARMGHV